MRLLALSALLAGLALPVAAERRLDPGDIRLEKGYRIEAAVAGLTLPTAAAFDGDALLVAESGFQSEVAARILRVGSWGGTEVVADEGLRPPVMGLLVMDGTLAVSHRGAVSVLESAGSREVVGGLPSHGDHSNNQLALGPDGRIYLGQGTVTNAGVVGLDNLEWLARHPRLHEVPCQDVVLVGQRFETDNPLTEARDRAATGAYKPFGTTAAPGELARGTDRCGGSIARFAPDGSGFQVVAWGLRNPRGLRFDRAGRLFVTAQGAEVRGSRSIFNDPDLFVRVLEGAWYGWPDFFDGEPASARRFGAPDRARPRLLWQHHPPLARAFTTFPSHSAAGGFDFSPGGSFGFEGDAFVTASGPAGLRVVRVDMKTGAVDDFARNATPGPAQGGFYRPVDAVFGPDGALYVVDFGVVSIGDEGPRPVPGTGVVWRIYREESGALWPRGPAMAPVAGRAATPREPLLPTRAQLLAAIALALFGGAFVVLLRRRRARARTALQTRAGMRSGDRSRRASRSAGPS